jgi:hypothetical protein
MKKGTKPILGGTFQGPDEILEVLAMRLHRVGASIEGGNRDRPAQATTSISRSGLRAAA